MGNWAGVTPDPGCVKHGRPVEALGFGRRLRDAGLAPDLLFRRIVDATHAAVRKRVEVFGQLADYQVVRAGAKRQRHVSLVQRQQETKRTL